MCPTKQLVTQQVKHQPKTQVEQEEKPQVQDKTNHEDGGDSGIRKKKTRRGGRARHPMLIQDAKMMTKNRDEKKNYAHIKCFKCNTLPRGVLPSLRRRFKQLMRDKTMGSNTWARKKRLNPREVDTHARKGDTWLIHVP
jgi:hypothetical protein